MKNPNLAMNMSQSVDLLLPACSQWTSVRIDINDVVRAAVDGSASKASVQSVILVATKSDSTFTGMDNAGVGSVKVQLYGSRMCITADVDEVMGHILSDSTAEAIQWLTKLEADALPDISEVSSLRAFLVRVGDVVFHPPGMVIVDRPCNGECSLYAPAT